MSGVILKGSVMAKEKYLQFGVRQKIYQGSGCVSVIPRILETEGWTRVMLIADPNLYAAGVIKPIEDMLKDAQGVKYTLFTNIRPNPEALTIEAEAIPLAHKFDADVLIAVGGGSTIDTAKGVALVGKTDHGVMDFMGWPPDKPLPHITYPIVAVPSTAGTGSEVCRNAVICDKNGYKLVPMHESILPVYALMDPDLLAGLPFAVAAATAMDAFTHALESYTNMNANDFTELFSLHALELIGEAIRPFVANPAVTRWANMMSLGCMYAGFSLGIASIGQDHVITHPMSEDPLHMPHGDACGIVLPAVIEWNAPGCKEKYRKAYNAITKKNISEGDFEVQMLIDWVVDLCKDLHIANGKTFEEWGYNGSDVLELMLKHPIFNNKDKIPNEQCAYPRVTKMKDFAYLIERTNEYSKIIAGKN
jgi:alcohol dehydrogenase class IV